MLMKGELCITPILQRRWAFPQFRGSPAKKRDLFSGLSAGDSYPLRIPFARAFDFTPRCCSGAEPVERLRAMSKVEWLRAAVSPTSKPRKDNVLPPVTAKKPIVLF